MNKHKRIFHNFFTNDAERESDPLKNLISSTAEERYDQKHFNIGLKEPSFINKLQPTCCPYCTSAKFVKNGKRKDQIQTYICKSCGKRFNLFTGTIFDSHKIPITEWIEFLLKLFSFGSVTYTAIGNQNAETTGFYWLEKVFIVLKNCQKDVRLSGKIYYDETFTNVNFQDRKYKNNKKLRGISRNKIAIGVAVDKHNLLIIDEKVSKPSNLSTRRVLVDKIEPGSTLIHDEEKSHEYIVKKLNLKSIVYNSKSIKNCPDEENPLNKVNRIHGFIKSFFERHLGFDRFYLQDRLNLIWFILSEPFDFDEKILKFFKMAISTKKILRYRDYYKK